MMYDYEYRYLQHFGIPGMKWGVRRAVGSDGLVTNVGKKTRSLFTKKEKASKPEKPEKKPTNKSEDYVESRALKSKTVAELSNAELQAINKRLQLEKQYKELNPAKVSMGKKIAKTVIKKAGDTVIDYASKETARLVTEGLDALLKKSLKK